MKSMWFAGMFVAATLACAAPPLLAQEEGKTKAEAILIFPKVTKAGLMVGGQYGEGTLLKKETAVA
jgi:lipid-binding SYLF domain-containing protein